LQIDERPSCDDVQGVRGLDFLRVCGIAAHRRHDQHISAVLGKLEKTICAVDESHLSRRWTRCGDRLYWKAKFLVQPLEDGERPRPAHQGAIFANEIDFHFDLGAAVTAVCGSRSGGPLSTLVFAVVSGKFRLRIT
jgi:hypothetical protein